MATKYILDPSGNIIKVEDGVIETESGKVIKKKPEETDYLSEVNKEQNVESGDAVSYLGLSEFSSEETVSDFIKSTTKNDPSFNFINTTQENVKDSYKPFNSFLDNEEKHPKVYADEFEMLTGLRYREDERVNSLEAVPFMLSYTVESVVRIATVESIVQINKLALSPRQNEAIERYNLRIGRYDFTEYDTFTRYVYNVLNYPHENSTVEERVSAYFLGFAAWLSPDMAIDINNIIKANAEGDNFIQSNGTGNVVSSTLMPLKALGLASLEILASAITNTSSVNRLKLLIRKFYQEKYWNSEKLLFSAKDRNLVLDFFTDMNFYYFKFYIERVQIGLKLLEKYYYNNSYLKNSTTESLSRVAASKINNKISDPIISGINYEWNQTKSDRTRTSFFSNAKPSSPTRVRALPQVFNLHDSVLKNLAFNGKTSLDMSEDLRQNFYSHKERRIPQELVEQIENRLEAEYMPFYFHDLRTNEIISFHAFIESISDSFNPDYNAASGFGRIDDVRSYVKTTRNINVSFIVAATSEPDHDLMWYQINKLVAMCYPQWSDAYEVVSKDENGNLMQSEFKYPFTQVPTASPLIRLRVGDVIKSNYSRTSLSRLHGIGDIEVKEISDDDFIEKNRSISEKQKDILRQIKEVDKKIKKNKEETSKINDSFKEKKATTMEDLQRSQELEKQLYCLGNEKFKLDQGNEKLKAEKLRLKKSKELTDVMSVDVEKTKDSFNYKFYLLPGMYKVVEKPTKLNTSSISAFGSSIVSALTPNLKTLRSINLQHEIEVKILEKEKGFAVVEFINKEKFSNYCMLVDINKLYYCRSQTLTNDIELQKMREYSNNIMSPVKKADNSSNNPITRAYESGMSRGLAGFITNLDLNYNESTWETGRIGSKAPIFVKINVTFTPIHDIPPGLDHNGMLRAPVYNVGRINNELFGDPHDSDGGHNSGRKKALAQKYYFS